MKRLFYHTILLFTAVFLSHHLNAQFDPANFNEKLLEHEIKVRIDSVRKAHNLLPLYNDSILYVASKHHANYVLKKGVLTHEELENKAMLSPQNRIVSYGAPSNYFAGENLVYTVYNANVKVKDKIFQTDNYATIANSLVYSWVNSKGHFLNMIDPDYDVTGLAIAVDPKTKRIYACQKFANVLYQYSFKENSTMFPYSELKNAIQAYVPPPETKEKYPFKLRDDDTAVCEECRETWAMYPGMSVRVSNNNFILRIENADFVKSLIENKWDGFAVEIVPFDAFACGNPAYEKEPSRRNVMKRTSGTLLEPVFRNDLIKGFKKRKKVKNLNFVKYIFSADSVSFFKRFGRYKLVNFDAKYFEIKLGKVPKNMTGWWNHNLVYIHKKQICHVVYLTSYPGEVVTEFASVDYFPPVPVNDYEFNLEKFSDTLELFYNSGQTITNSTGLSSLIKRFDEQHLTIKSIQIEGFSSVEGDSLSNESLHQQRATNILSELKKYTNSDTRYSTQSRVAWEHFYTSIKNHKKWGFLYSKSKSEISDYLANPKNEKPNEILTQERKVKVVVLAVKELSPQNAKYYLNRDLKMFYYKDAHGDLRISNMGKLQKLYEKAYYLTTVDTFGVNDFLAFTIPKAMDVFPHSFEHEMAFYPYHYLRDSKDKVVVSKAQNEVKRVFEMCGAPEHLTKEFHYLSACLITESIRKKGKKLLPEDKTIYKAFDRLNGMFEGYELDSSFYINVAKANLNIINILMENIGPDEIYKYNDVINSSLIQIVEYYRNTNQLNPEKVVKLSKLLCYYQNIPLAVELCHDYLYDNEVLKIYLPLAYVHSSYLTDLNEKLFEAEFQQLLQEARTRLSSKEWCDLFYGKNGIPFQVMDNKELHESFCETCPNRVQELFVTD